MKIAFYKSNKGTLLDWLINFLTGRYGFSHVELVFPTYTKGNLTLCFSASPRDNLVRFKYINLNTDSWVVLDLPNIDEKQTYKKTLDFLGKKYDYIGILFWFLIPLKKQANNKWWCSEITAKLIGIKNYRIHPNELYLKLKGIK